MNQPQGMKICKVCLFGEELYSCRSKEEAFKVYRALRDHGRELIRYDRALHKLIYSKEEIEMLGQEREPAKKRAKRDFKAAGNPAMSFISVPDGEPQPQIQPEPKGTDLPLKAENDVPAGYRRNPEFIELKSKRVQLVLQPSVADEIKALAKAQGMSLNETITEAIKDYLKKENAHG